MTHREFFWAVKGMRAAQQEYFKTRDPKMLRVCKARETDIDNEIKRVCAILIRDEMVERACNTDCAHYNNGTCPYIDKEECPRYRSINNINTVNA